MRLVQGPGVGTSEACSEARRWEGMGPLQRPWGGNKRGICKDPRPQWLREGQRVEKREAKGSDPWGFVGDNTELTSYLDIGRSSFRGVHTPCDCHVENLVPLLDPQASAADGDTSIPQTGRLDPMASE